VVAKVRERLSLNKQCKKFDMERFNIKKLNDVEVKEQYQAKISNRFAALENDDDDDDDNDDDNDMSIQLGKVVDRISKLQIWRL
jgi:hypothetical protein